MVQAEQTVGIDTSKAARSLQRREPAAVERRAGQAKARYETYSTSLAGDEGKKQSHRTQRQTAAEQRREVAAAAQAVEVARETQRRDTSMLERAAAEPARALRRQTEAASRDEAAVRDDGELDGPQRRLASGWDREMSRGRGVARKAAAVRLATETARVAAGGAAHWSKDPAEWARWAAVRALSEQLSQIKTGDVCSVCQESWPATVMHKWTRSQLDGEPMCERCFRDKSEVRLFSAENDMDPGVTPAFLPKITIVEEALISTYHQHIFVLRNTGGGEKYRGHVVVFEQKLQGFLDSLPIRVCDIDNVLLVRKTGEAGYDKEFRVRRALVEMWLRFLVEHNPAYIGRVRLNTENLSALPEDRNVGA